MTAFAGKCTISYKLRPFYALQLFTQFCISGDLYPLECQLQQGLSAVSPAEVFWWSCAQRVWIRIGLLLKEQPDLDPQFASGYMQRTI